MFIKSFFSRNAVDYAGAKILGDSALDTATIVNLRKLFFDTQFVEHGNFSDLHKIVVNIRPDAIEEELEKSTAALDTVDITRRYGQRRKATPRRSECSWNTARIPTTMTTQI